MTRNRLDAPTACDSCQSPNVAFVRSNRENASAGWPWIWLCRDCDASVGTHPSTRSPLGHMADAPTRYWRRMAHLALDPLWRCGALNREAAYTLLAERLDITADECHLALLSIKQLKQAVKICADLEKEYRTAARRVAKKRKKHAKRKEIKQKREANHGNWSKSWRRPNSE